LPTCLLSPIEQVITDDLRKIAGYRRPVRNAIALEKPERLEFPDHCAIPQDFLAGLWENWKNPATHEWVRTFTIITVPSNDLVGRIHDWMPAILDRRDYDRWLRREADPHDLLVTYPSEPMRNWPISKRVNKPENDDPAILEPVELDAA
jgi:hypothetical protein